MTECRGLLRPMRPSDLDWVAEQEALAHVSPWSIGHFRDSIQAGYSCWVFVDSDTAIGYAVLMTVLDEAHLLNITVVGASRRQGWGARLLEAIASAAYDNGARQMFLEVRPSNLPARGLYEKHGFRIIGRRPGYYPGVDGQREDAIVMHRELAHE
ncbi:ribosomal protein S18-alanine N-acetyltransferase [Niveibacterium umoris]|uniref:[Ribosomal protein bS18]-alanine N-acetyltransferase n=1 Tax=Niveibacterium umoris TaxID=1193620 RepID=A0A840BGL8_9RHOO|nr:ribosomal protein S18-alanine N-acetyltransferase [Niveibacterium umoris]MBB4010742.1 ribosomal-protein-alanine N-acetyltransferase [Niveibacterium umoris]